MNREPLKLDYSAVRETAIKGNFFFNVSSFHRRQQNEKKSRAHIKIRKNFRKEVKNKSALGLRRVDFILGDYYYCELFGLASKAVL